MPAARADEIARTTSPSDVVAYAQAALDAATAWLGRASEEALTAAVDRFEQVTLQAHQTAPAYVDELEWMRGRPAWRMLVSPCFGHIRGQLAELDLALTALRT